jgi:hypothetical protein
MAARKPWTKCASASTRIVVLALLVPILIVAQLLGGRAALVHAHDDHESHLHLWHGDTSHADVARSVSHGAPGDEPPLAVEASDPTGVLVALPGILAARVGAKAADATIAPPVHAVPVGALALAEGFELQPRARSREPDRLQVRRHRSGVELLVGTSRALLI